MPTIYLDSALNDEQRRHRLYGGDLFAFSPGESATKLAELARELSEAAFAPHDPQVAQESMPAERYVEILAELKPDVHPPPSREGADRRAAVGAGLRHREDLLRRAAASHDGARRVPEGGPRLPVPPTSRHLVLGSPPAAQLVAAGLRRSSRENCMAFHPQYFDTPVRNSSAGYDYEEWSKTGRQQAAKQVKKETRKQPQAEEPLELEPDVRVVTPPGGTLVFSAAQLHSTVPNTTEPHALQHRLPHGQPGRPGRRRGGAEHRLGVHGHDAPRLPARERPRAAARGDHRHVRQASRGGRGSRVTGCRSARQPARSAEWPRISGFAPPNRPGVNRQQRGLDGLPRAPPGR